MRAVLTYHRIIFLFIISTLLLISCTKEGDNPDPAAPALAQVTDITFSDNGNENNGSDVEVNFIKQSDLSNIRSYHIFLLKAGSVLDVTAANNLSTHQFLSVNPGQIITIKGATFLSSSTDTDGDLIKDNVPYQVGILTQPVDNKLASSSLTISAENYSLSKNNIITDFTQEIEAGAGSLSINSEGEIFMADYNIIDDLTATSEKLFQIYQISPIANVSPLGSPLEVLSGNAIDGNDVLYQCELFTGQIYKHDNLGNRTALSTTGYSIRQPEGIYIKDDGTVYTVNRKTSELIEVSPYGSARRVAVIQKNPRGITGDHEGNLYISHNDESGHITKISPDGKSSLFATIPTYKPENYLPEYIQWLGYITYHDNALYVAGLSTNRIYKVNMGGEVSVFAGSGNRGIPRGGALTANLNRPMGLVFSNDGKYLYFSACTDITPTHTQASYPSKVLRIALVNS